VSGDTLIGIANQHGITLQELLSYNGIQTNSLIRPNDQLVVSRCSVPFEGDVGVEVSGLIDSVNAENVLVADFAPFVNTVGNGSQMILAEPGVLLTHDATEAEIRASNGAIDRFNSLNQIVLNHPEETQTGCGEGRFVWAVGNTLTAEIEDVRIHLPGAVGENWFLLIRCRFSDEQPDADAGSEIVFTDYIPGFAQVMLMPKGAFVSEEAFLQAAEISTSTYSCGSESCSRLKVAFLDVNTDAFAVATYTRESGWQSVSSNVSGS
jgi:hypothetical protein